MRTTLVYITLRTQVYSYSVLWHGVKDLFEKPCRKKEVLQLCWGTGAATKCMGMWIRILFCKVLHWNQLKPHSTQVTQSRLSLDICHPAFQNFYICVLKLLYLLLYTNSICCTCQEKWDLCIDSMNFNSLDSGCERWRWRFHFSIWNDC